MRRGRKNSLHHARSQQRGIYAERLHTLDQPNAAGSCTDRRQRHAQDAGTLKTAENDIRLQEKAAGCRCYVSSCPNRHVSSHRRWRQGWRQCLSEKDSRPDGSDHDTRSEEAGKAKNSTGLRPKIVVREPMPFLQKLIK